MESYSAGRRLSPIQDAQTLFGKPCPKTRNYLTPHIHICIRLPAYIYTYIYIHRLCIHILIATGARSWDLRCAQPSRGQNGAWSQAVGLEPQRPARVTFCRISGCTFLESEGGIHICIYTVYTYTYLFVCVCVYIYIYT